MNFHHKLPFVVFFMTEVAHLIPQMSAFLADLFWYYLWSFSPFRKLHCYHRYLQCMHNQPCQNEHTDRACLYSLFQATHKACPSGEGGVHWLGSTCSACFVPHGEKWFLRQPALKPREFDKLVSTSGTSSSTSPEIPEASCPPEVTGLSNFSSGTPKKKSNGNQNPHAVLGYPR